MRTAEHSIRAHMGGLMAQADYPQMATELAEETAAELNMDHWLDDPAAEVWDIASEFFDVNGCRRPFAQTDTFTINSQDEMWLN